MGSSSDHKEPLDDCRFAFSSRMGVSVATKEARNLPQQVLVLPGVYIHTIHMFITATGVGALGWILKLY
jgi:hypothetical protein